MSFNQVIFAYLLIYFYLHLFLLTFIYLFHEVIKLISECLTYIHIIFSNKLINETIS